MSIYLPNEIKQFTASKSYESDNIGLSGSTVLIYDDMVLKIEPYNESLDSTVAVMKWAGDKLPVPKVMCYTVENDISYLLMSRITGEISCDEFYMEQSDTTVDILANGINMLQNTDITGCPKEISFADDLATVQFNVDNNLVDETVIDYTLLNRFGITNIKELLKWLKSNVPDYEPVLSHGDYCMPNVVLKNEDISGFIDLGEMAISDKWKDIALCYISLKNNFNGFFGGKIYPDFYADTLFEKLGIKPDWNKLNYYFLLNELFKTK